MKTVLKGILFYGLVAATWFGLSQIDFVGFFQIEKKSDIAEEKIGDILWESIEESEDVIYDDSIVSGLDSLINPLCKANDIERDSLKVHIVDKDEVNAFAMPNNHLVVYTGLIEASKKQEALIGVLGHEIAHLEHNHVMKKLSKEIGVSVITNVITGGKASQMSEIMHTITSSAYDRSLEKEADLQSVKYLLKAEIDPRPFADFMYELSTTTGDIESFTFWMASHPESKDRAKYILNYLKGRKIKTKQLLTKENWTKLQEQITNYK